MRSLIKAAIFSVFLLNSLWVFAGPTIADYGALPSVSNLSVSPDGKLVAFRKVTDSVNALVVHSLAEKKQVAALDMAGMQPQTITFIGNNKVYVFASEYRRVEGFAGAFDASSGFVFDLDAKKVLQLLTPGEDGIFPGQTGLGQILGVAPDGQSVFMPAFLGDTGLVLGNQVKPSYSLLKVELGAKGKFQKLIQGLPSTRNFFIDTLGNPYAEERYDEKKNEHSVWVYESKEAKLLFKENVPIITKSYKGLTRDRQELIFTETTADDNHTKYFSMNIKTAAVKEVAVSRDDASIDHVIKNAFGEILGVVYSGFSPSYLFFDSKMNEKMKKIVEMFPEHSIYLEDYSNDFSRAVILVSGSRAAGDYYLVDENNQTRFLASQYPNIKEENLSPIGKITYSARDGLKIPTLITIPQDKVGALKNLPAVIYPHGGPESHDQIGFDSFAQALASQGYLVIQPQFRGSDAFGLKHKLAGHGEWGKKMQDDLTDAVNFFVAKGIIDKSRVCIVGASYGGYAALAGGAFTPDVYKCVVAINAVSDLPAMYAWDKAKAGKDSWIVTYMERQFGNGIIDNKALEKWSPVSAAENFLAPVLLVHAENDSRVPLKQSSEMQSKLKKHKKSVEFIVLKGDNHNLRETKTRQQAVEGTVNFVKRHLN
jgi:dipeptidyl aminopeptidase/acylaminoacyl peptidase